MGSKATNVLCIINLTMMLVLIGGLLWYIRVRQNTDLGHFFDMNSRLVSILDRLDGMEKKLHAIRNPQTSTNAETPAGKAK